MDGGASSPATATPCGKRIRFPAEIVLIGISRGLRLSQALPGARRGRIPLHTTLSQIPLKSCGFPGAESARKRFFLRGASPRSEKISTRGDQPKSSISLGRSQSDSCLPFGQATFPPRRSSASIGSREGSHPLALSRGCSDGDFGFRRSRLFFCGRCFRRHGRGALCSPTPPRVTGARGLRPSRALPELVWRGVWFPTMQGCSFDGIRFRRCGNCSLEVFRSRRRERGALCSPTPPRATGARGLRPSRALPGLDWREVWFLMEQGTVLAWRI